MLFISCGDGGAAAILTADFIEAVRLADSTIVAAAVAKASAADSADSAADSAAAHAARAAAAKEISP